VFDVDGVLVDSPHELAWREALEQLMETSWSAIRDQTAYSPGRFTPEVYRAHMSGKTTFSGARAALHYFGVPDDDARTEEYGRRKQQVMGDLLEAGELTAYPDALRFVLAVREAGIPAAAASSSKNAAQLLSQIRLDAFAEQEAVHFDFIRPGLTLLDVFDADVSGRDFPQGANPTPRSSLPPRGRSASPPTCASPSKTPSPASRPPKQPRWPSSDWHGRGKQTSSPPPRPT